jgi:hypothetical protein
MFENEDVILPDDFEMDTTPDEVTEETVDETLEPFVDEVEDTTPTEQTEEARQEALQALKVKFNHEEREIPIDEAIPLVQKGLNYDKVQERLQQLESDPRLTFVQELAEQFNMSPEEYISAVKQQREQEAINELVQQNIPEEYAKEMLESRKFREQLETERQTKAEEEKQNAEYNEFFNYFREANGKDFNPDKDEIPPTVWEATQNGVPLKYAYMEHQNQQYKSQLQTLKQNVSNTKKAPVGSVTQHGSTELAVDDDFLKGFNSI